MRMNFFMAKKNVQINKEKLRDQQELIEKIQDSLKKLNTISSPDPISIPDGANVDMQQLANLFVSKGQLFDLEKRVEFCEGKTQKNETNIDSNDKRISDLEAQYRSLAGSLSALDNKLSGLGKISGIVTPSIPLNSSGDNSQMMELLQQLQFAISNKLDSSRFDDIMQKLDGKANKTDIVPRNEIKDKFERFEKMINDNSRRILDSENKIRTLENEI